VIIRYTFAMPILHRLLYHALILAGRPIGGMRPRRLYDMLGRRAYPAPDFHWHKNRWGDELFLSHHFHLDRNILIHGDYDHPLHQLIEARVKPGIIALDVGANLGEITLHLARRVGPGGKVFAFEPFPAAFERLRAHVERNHAGNVTPVQLALSDHQGEAPMAVPDVAADNQGLGSIMNLAAWESVGRVNVPLATLDAFVARESIPKIDFIKLDIQGAEYAFLQGGARTLAAHRPEIVTEVSPADLAAAGSTSRDFLELVESMGYAIHLIAGGRPARRLHAADISPDFAATNILCLPDAQG
jgi:FkbM family methyltransferase